MSDFGKELSDLIQGRIRDVPDFPKPGIIFKDLTPVFGHGPSLRAITDAFAARYRNLNINAIAGIEARGFVTATPVASALETGLVLLRKPGKLPYKTVSKSYALEYGEDSLEMHEDAVGPGSRVVIIDDLLATGGTMSAAIDLIQAQGATVVEVGFIVELAFLAGRARFEDVSVGSMVIY